MGSAYRSVKSKLIKDETSLMALPETFVNKLSACQMLAVGYCLRGSVVSKIIWGLC